MCRKAGGHLSRVPGMGLGLTGVRYSSVGLGLTVRYSAVGLGLTVRYSAVGLGLTVRVTVR